VIYGVDLSATSDAMLGSARELDAVIHCVETCNLDAMKHGVDTAVFDGILERSLMSTEFRPHGRKDLLAPEPNYHPCKKAGNHA
jgi:hypothetical protein